MTSQAFLLHTIFMLDFPGGVSGKESDCECGRCKRCGFNPWVRKIPREGNGNPLQYSPLGKPMDRGGWWATVHGVTKSWTRLSRHTHTFVLYNLCPLTYETRCHLKRAGIISYDWTSDLSKAQHLFSRPRPSVKRTETDQSSLMLWFTYRDTQEAWLWPCDEACM